MLARQATKKDVNPQAIVGLHRFLQKRRCHCNVFFVIPGAPMQFKISGFAIPELSKNLKL